MRVCYLLDLTLSLLSLLLLLLGLKREVQQTVAVVWQAVHGLTINVRKMFLEMDQALYEDCQRKFNEEEEKAESVESAREETWKLVERVAGMNPLPGGAVVEASY